MSLAFSHTELLLSSSTFYKRVAPPSRRRHRAWKRYRLKPTNLFNPSSSPFENLFTSLLSQFPSVNNLSYIAPALGFASGLALFFSSKPPKLLPNPEDVTNSDVGEWILFSSPTPFNRFVTLRCASISLVGRDLLEDVNEKLVKEGTHYVSLNCGRIVGEKSEDHVEGKMVYQRVCVGTEDGGVLSLDWPANLELEEERGLDTTVLIVPGTSEGSNERNIKVFVCECLRRGVFPIVMNPRGCAGSPLTTARLFTAADSDGISTVVQFIRKNRPWTTLMGVGWGYGANMLTKYLADFGERAPLTAATCIDNPFNLEEAAKSSLYDRKFGQSLTEGFISILQGNKEIFQGRGKGFDIERALSASSIKDFDESISIVSYGFDNVEDFYEKSSTRDAVGKLKIPVIFIQNDDGALPLFSIPRDLIAENPYTSLLLCSYFQNSRNSGFTFSWCHNLIIEWLAAVELGILKGRHPLLEDVDVSINPSKGLALVNGMAFNRSDSKNKFLNLSNGYSSVKFLSEMRKKYDIMDKIQSIPVQDEEKLSSETKGLHGEGYGVDHQVESIDAETEDEANSLQNERGQVLQTAHVLMNMLDATVPDTLTEEQKKKVLDAVGQGEMLMKALQDAVPEDVRGKLTSSVSEIVQAQGSNLKFDELLKLGLIPDVASSLKSKLQEKITFSKPSGGKEVDSSDQNRSNEPGGDSNLFGYSSDELHLSMESKNQSSENLESSSDLGVNVNTPESEQFSDHNCVKTFDDNEIATNISADKELPNQKEGLGDTQDNSRDHAEKNSEYNQEFSADNDDLIETNQMMDQSTDPSSPLKNQRMENDTENNEKKEERDPHVSCQISAAPPSFSISQALDALTGFDDSTQVAVNSVFQVIEGMIDQLDVRKDDDQVKNGNNKEKINVQEEVENLNESVTQHGDQDVESGRMGDPNSVTGMISVNSNMNPKGPDEKSELRDKYEDHRNYNSPINKMKGHAMLNMYKNSNNLSGIPCYLPTPSCGDPLYKEYLKTYILSKMRNANVVGLDKKSALYMDYFPEDGQWKLLEQVEDTCESGEEFETRNVRPRNAQIDVHSRSKNIGYIIEPSFAKLHPREKLEQDEKSEELAVASDHIESLNINSADSMLYVENLIRECLNIEVSRRVSTVDIEELELKVARDVEYVANAVSLATRHVKEHVTKQNGNISEILDSIHGQRIVDAIAFATQDTEYLKRVLPLGVIVGSSLTALRKFLNGSALDVDIKKDVGIDQIKKLSHHISVGKNDKSSKNVEDGSGYGQMTEKFEDKIGFQGSRNNRAMAGAVTAALGASALLIHQQNTQTSGTPVKSFKNEEKIEEPSILGELPEKFQNNIVTSLAEKAMSVASPVVPTTEDGEVDHDRLVAMLAELGQKGGILKLIGKVALLWGGIRGAMSLTDKLISFLRIADRPLFQRVLGFVFMVLLMWSPVIVPFFPSLMRSWTAKSPSKFVELACIGGLYASVLVMVILWGKRIRKYDDPVQQYGLDLASLAKFQIFLKSFAGGAMLVLLIHVFNSSLGCMQFYWPTALTLRSEPFTLLKSYAHMLLLIVKGIATATSVATVEELLFRSWLPREIATDFGHHRGIIISALAFSLSQRSIWEIPGLWLLSLSLSGACQRCQGSLSFPIGLRSGILACSFILKSGGFLIYKPNHHLPPWFTGGHPFQPFSGVVGLAFSLVLAIIMYQRQPLPRAKTARVIKN